MYFAHRSLALKYNGTTYPFQIHFVDIIQFVYSGETSTAFPDTMLVLYMQSLSAIKACLKKGIRYLSNNCNYLSMIYYYVFVKMRAAPRVSCQSPHTYARYSIVYIMAQTGKQLTYLANELKRDRTFHRAHIIDIAIEWWTIGNQVWHLMYVVSSHNIIIIITLKT